MELEIKYNEAYNNFLASRNRIAVLYGTASSGKSIVASQKLTRRFFEETDQSLPHKILILRKNGRDVKDSVFDEIKSRITEWDQLGRVKINESPANQSITDVFTGNKFIFRGLDDHQKIKSIANITGMWLEEATDFEEEDFLQLLARIRGKRPFYVQYILTFNPIDETHWLKKYIEREKDNIFWQFCSWKDNAFLEPEDVKILESYKNISNIFYQIYYKGEWGIWDRDNKFFWSFSKEENVRDDLYLGGEDSVLWLSFDFNIDPMSCIVAQKSGDMELRILNEIRLDNSDIFQMLDRIETMYPEWVESHRLICTGDATGKKREGTVRGKTNYWQIIRQHLKLKDFQLKVRKRNIGLIDSKVLCNAVLMHINFYISSRCENVINDCMYAKCDPSGLLIKKPGEDGNHFLDCVRYLIDAVYPDFTKHIKKYARQNTRAGGNGQTREPVSA